MVDKDFSPMAVLYDYNNTKPGEINGISPDHVQKLRAFIDNHNGAAGAANYLIDNFEGRSRALANLNVIERMFPKEKQRQIMVNKIVEILLRATSQNHDLL